MLNVGSICRIGTWGLGKTAGFRLLTTAGLLLLFAPASAQWSHDPNVNNAVCTATGDQSVPTIVTDGSGGAIITWRDNRNGNQDIYAQRISASGTVQWTSDGVAICTATGDQMSPTIASDGLGGAIITWYDLRDGMYDIYAQRIDISGTAQWTSNGVPICTATGGQYYPTIVSDGSSGAIITWQDSRNGNYDIYAQRINASGTVQWTSNGVAICTVAGDQSYPTIVSDGSSGAIITWRDYRSGSADIYVQRINASGAVQWTSNGVAVCTLPGLHFYPTIVSDGSGGAIIAWHDTRSSDSDIYAQWIKSSGTVQWTSGGAAICTATANQVSAAIASDGSGGAIISWRDYRNGSADIYAQRVNPLGSVLWTSDGSPICTAMGDQSYPVTVSDGSGGAIIAWWDPRNGDNNIFAQRIGASGKVQWTSDGAAICTVTGSQELPNIASDGSIGAIITWRDSRDGNYDVYVQRVDKFGYLGIASPTLLYVNDVPNDQGGHVTLAWSSSYVDANPYDTLTHYSVWRGIDLSSSSIQQTEASLNARSVLTGGKRYRTRIINGDQTYWEWICDVPGHFLPRYSYTGPTTSDSCPSAFEYVKFFVSAQTANPYVFWDSNIDSGYSVDNIAPDPPADLSGSVVSEQVKLRWKKNSEPDFGRYLVYRSASPIVRCDESMLLSDVSDTGYTDPTPLKMNTSYYAVCAEDIHGNPSNASNQVSFTPDDFPVAVTVISFTAEATAFGVSLRWETGAEIDNAGFVVLRQAETEPSFMEISSYKANQALKGLGTNTLGQSYSFIDNTVAAAGVYTYRVESVTTTGRVDKYMEIEVNVSLPGDFALHQNYPNPFNPTTTIAYTLPTAQHVRIEVIDAVGQTVAVLVDEEESAGFKSAVFDGSNHSSGIYFCRMQAGQFTQVKKMILLK